MICCVIGGALFALISARLASLPVIGGMLARRQRGALDPSTWRLEPERSSEIQP